MTKTMPPAIEQAHVGRPVEVEVSRRAVTLDDDTVKVMKRLGGGNLSLGIRVAARQLAKKPKASA